jgi:gluconolactonase
MMLITASAIVSCNNSTDTKMAASKYQTIGTIERIDPTLDSIISVDAKIEVIADSFDWSEGPVWIESKRRCYSQMYRRTSFTNGQRKKERKFFSHPLVIQIREAGWRNGFEWVNA